MDDKLTEEDLKKQAEEFHKLAIEVKRKLIARTPSKHWKLTISKMSDAKVIETYLRMAKKGQI